MKFQLFKKKQAHEQAKVLQKDSIPNGFKRVQYFDEEGKEKSALIPERMHILFNIPKQGSVRIYRESFYSDDDYSNNNDYPSQISDIAQRHPSIYTIETESPKYDSINEYYTDTDSDSIYSKDSPADTDSDLLEILDSYDDSDSLRYSDPYSDSDVSNVFKSSSRKVHDSDSDISNVFKSSSQNRRYRDSDSDISNIFKSSSQKH